MYGYIGVICWWNVKYFNIYVEILVGVMLLVVGFE